MDDTIIWEDYGFGKKTRVISNWYLIVLILNENYMHFADAVTRARSSFGSLGGLKQTKNFLMKKKCDKVDIFSTFGRLNQHKVRDLFIYSSFEGNFFVNIVNFVYSFSIWINIKLGIYLFILSSLYIYVSVVLRKTYILLNIYFNFW